MSKAISLSGIIYFYIFCSILIYYVYFSTSCRCKERTCLLLRIIAKNYTRTNEVSNQVWNRYMVKVYLNFLPIDTLYLIHTFLKNIPAYISDLFPLLLLYEYLLQYLSLDFHILILYSISGFNIAIYLLKWNVS